jgi:hypothetical protein
MRTAPPAQPQMQRHRSDIEARERRRATGERQEREKKRDSHHLAEACLDAVLLISRDPLVFELRTTILEAASHDPEVEVHVILHARAEQSGASEARRVRLNARGSGRRLCDHGRRADGARTRSRACCLTAASGSCCWSPRALSSCSPAFIGGTGVAAPDCQPPPAAGHVGRRRLLRTPHAGASIGTAWSCSGRRCRARRAWAGSTAPGSARRTAPVVAAAARRGGGAMIGGNARSSRATQASLVWQIKAARSNRGFFQWRLFCLRLFRFGEDLRRGLSLAWLPAREPLPRG